MYQLCLVGDTHSRCQTAGFQRCAWAPESIPLVCLYFPREITKWSILAFWAIVSLMCRMLSLARCCPSPENTASLLFCCFSSHLLWEISTRLESLLVPPLLWAWIRTTSLSSYWAHSIPLLLSWPQCIRSISIFKKE